MQPLQSYIAKGGKRLRLGYTTGSCAAAAACAAAQRLLTGDVPQAVRLETPAGLPVLVEIEACTVLDAAVRCTVVKDGGDDPDITNGTEVGCTVSKTASGFRAEGGEGVGRVTKPGLACAVGEAAINPVPRKMIAEQLERQALESGYSGGLLAVVDVPQGRALAGKTFNPRLGIEGGISILGTTGIVEPMSEGALVSTIHAEMDSLRASGRDSILIVPGNYGEDFAKEAFGISLERGVKCSNFIGEALDYAVLSGFSDILLVGHAGKLVKLAGGIMNTHSRTADGRMEILTAHAALHAAPLPVLRQLMDCVTIDAADELLLQHSIAGEVWGSVGQKIRTHIRHRLGTDAVNFTVAAFAKRGVVYQSGEIDPHKEDFR